MEDNVYNPRREAPLHFLLNQVQIAERVLQTGYLEWLPLSPSPVLIASQLRDQRSVRWPRRKRLIWKTSPAARVNSRDVGLCAVSRDVGLCAVSRDVGLRAVSRDVGLCAVSRDVGLCAVSRDVGLRAVSRDVGLCAVSRDVGLCAVSRDVGLRAVSRDVGLCAVSRDVGLCAVSRDVGLCAVSRDVGLCAVSRDVGLCAVSRDVGLRAVSHSEAVPVHSLTHTRFMWERPLQSHATVTILINAAVGKLFDLVRCGAVGDVFREPKCTAIAMLFGRTPGNLQASHRVATSRAARTCFEHSHNSRLTVSKDFRFHSEVITKPLLGQQGKPCRLVLVAPGGVLPLINFPSYDTT
ncbi:hypothetical protein RRG08_065647 [Elysia crispata]|uniref:Uncharacterized protein n=1 Tax=Elysia crispata TaxID=231223 RepID=A0AAE0YNZ2_9GAST|nr:hypothetical protein RRG08_065647 [Elysia crispata]